MRCQWKGLHFLSKRTKGVGANKLRVMVYTIVRNCMFPTLLYSLIFAGKNLQVKACNILQCKIANYNSFFNNSTLCECFIDFEMKCKCCCFECFKVGASRLNAIQL